MCPFTLFRGVGTYRRMLPYQLALCWSVSASLSPAFTAAKLDNWLCLTGWTFILAERLHTCDCTPGKIWTHPAVHTVGWLFLYACVMHIIRPLMHAYSLVSYVKHSWRGTGKPPGISLW